jgi:hypothetical protein
MGRHGTKIEQGSSRDDGLPATVRGPASETQARYEKGGEGAYIPVNSVRVAAATSLWRISASPTRNVSMPDLARRLQSA